MRTAMLALALLLTGSGTAAAPSDARAAARGEAELAKLIAGRIAGKPEHCINTSDATNVRIVDGTAIVYDSGRTIYVNRPQGNLDTLREGDTLVSDLWGSQICALDQVRTVEPGSRLPHSIMALGAFLPYTRPAKR